MKRLIILLLAMLLLTSCSGKEEPLRVCVDASNEEGAKNLLKAWEHFHKGSETELVVIPKDSAAAEIVITELKTEIMSGGGPDVFILDGVYPNVPEQSPVLFSNPEKMMYAEVFLPLDEYIEQAQYMDLEQCQPAVMAAGRTDEGQMLLPITYEYYAALVRTDDMKGAAIPHTYEECFSCEDGVLMKAISALTGFSFHQSIGAFADYQAGGLLFSEDELVAWTGEQLAFRRKRFELHSDVSPVMVRAVNLAFMEELAQQKEECLLLPLPDRENRITANVTQYAAINRNTVRAEEAFSVLDLLFRRELMLGEGIKEGEKHYGNSVMSCLTGMSGDIPVYNEAFQGLCDDLPEEKRSEMQKLNSQISSVRINSELDKLLYDMFEQCTYSREWSEKEQEDCIRQTYRAMQMRLLE